MPINWNQPGPKNNALEYFKVGQELGKQAADARDKRELRSALAAVAANPDDPQAIAPIFERDPTLALKLYERQDERAFNSALGNYVAGNPMVPGNRQPRVYGPGGANDHPRQVRSYSPGQELEQSFDKTMPGPVSGYGGGTFDLDGKPVTPAKPDPNPDFAFLGDPQSERDQAFLTMLKRDPVRAMKIQSTMRDNFMGRLKDEHGFYTIAVEELGRVNDDAGWQRALQRLQPYSEAMGVDLGESVPLTYPGPEEVQKLMEQSLPIKDRLDYLMREANYDADNARADRNTDSMIATREGRLAEQQRYNTGKLENTRRGQDKVDARASRRGGGRSASGPKANTSLPLVKTPAEAAKLPKGTRFRTPDGQVRVRP